jgi:O-antigen/teichoic acid export membrane protein
MKWDSKLFKEIFSYGVNFQIISIVNMLFDPITKALLSRFGGLSVVGYYEMANRLVSYMRSFIISANQVIVPAIADLQENDPEKIKRVYLLNYQVLFFLSLPLFSAVIISAPIISEIWIGYFESNFVLFTILLSAGWFLNVLAGPAYFINLGTGELKWNVISHLCIGLMNLILGIILGEYYKGTGVVAAWVISLSVGSSLIYISYHLKNNISLESLIPKESRLNLLIYLIAIILLSYIYFKWSISVNKIYLKVFIASTFSMLVFFLSWRHPMGKNLTRWVRNFL